MPDISKADWERALKMDRKSLEQMQAAIKTLRGGGEVENLTLENALRVESGLKQVIKNKEQLIEKLASSATRDIFERALTVDRIATRFAMEHPSEKARRKYLKDHPGAEPAMHTVDKDVGKPPASRKKPDVDMSDVHPTDKNYDAVKKLREKRLRDTAKGSA